MPLTTAICDDNEEQISALRHCKEINEKFIGFYTR